MTDRQNSKPSQNPPSSNSRVSGEIGQNESKPYSGQKPHYPNPPETTNPDPVTLREQWKFAMRQYSRWYSHAWGTAILAGVSFFALGWIIKGSNPLPSFHKDDDDKPPNPPPNDASNVNQAR